MVLITGKGGVGRSVVTAALARLAVKAGRRVLVTEIGEDGEDYSPLAKHFGLARLPKDPSPVGENMMGAVLLARTGQELFLKSVLRSGTVARAALASESLRRLLSAGPSFREMGVFFQLLSYLRQKRDAGPEHELILIDMPATGHALALTGLPEQLLRLLPRGPIADSLREGQSYLNDPKLGAAWIVTLPETLPVSECLELIDGLDKTKMPIGGVLVNRLPDDPFTTEERAALTPLVNEQNWLGRQLFHRPMLALREVARLRANTKLPIITLPELPHAFVVDDLVLELGRARLVPLAPSSRGK